MSFRRILATLILLVVAVAATAQDAKRPSAKYENKELRLSFGGVYGWQTSFAEGAGAWSTLASYTEAALDATVLLQVTSNSYGSLADLRRSLEENFKEGEKPAPGSPAFKEIAFQQVEMRRGAKLPGIELTCYMVVIDPEGKKREKRVMSRVYMGRERLYRVHCVVKRSRAKRVEDLFVRALSSLKVSEPKEKVKTGTTFRSGPGKWSCTVPDGFRLFLPGGEELSPEMVFEDRAAGLKIEVFTFEFDGVLDDILLELEDEYGDEIEIVEDEVAVLGNEGIAATVTRRGRITRISGTIKGGLAYRIHTSSSAKKSAQGTELHARFLKDMKLER